MKKKKASKVPKRALDLIQAGEKPEVIVDEFVQHEFENILDGKKSNRSVKEAATAGLRKAKEAGVNTSNYRHPIDKR